MEPKFPGYRDKVVESFYKQGIVHTMDIKIDDFGTGWLHTTMPPAPGISQQHGYVHAGAISTMADLTSGYAAYSLIAEEEEVLTIEYKINFLRPAVGELFICRARVLKPGKSIHAAESEVYSQQNGDEKLIAKAFVTLAVVKGNRLAAGNE